MPEIERSSESALPLNGGPYLARVVNNLDPKYMGTLHVQLLREVGNTYNRQGQTIPVKYLSPFYGVTNVQHTDKNDNFNGTQKSYGFWAVPPDVGCLVLVVFIEGDIKQGYWIGCVQDEYMNFMVPGLAATEIHNDSTKGKKVVAEFNKQINDAVQTDTTQIKKPVHPFDSVINAQGLSGDETRGTTTSSARRDLPSNVYGWSTPGPLDRRPNAKTGTIGHYESKVTGAFVSRLGGSTFVMDDGDPTLLRKTPASQGPPEYVNIDNGEEGGNPTIPHNELVRIRTRTGHQILLHNSEDLIYIANARGTAWIELTSNGKIDIFAADSVSIHTKNDLNISADRDINMAAGRKVNILSGDKMHLGSGANMEIVSGSSTFITTSENINIGSGGNHIETATQIHMNGPQAQSAEPGDLPARVPQAEPWAGHENLNPAGHTPATKPAVNGKLTATPDTFKKVSK